MMVLDARWALRNTVWLQSEKKGCGLEAWQRGGRREGGNTLGVCDLTFPARASEPCTFPMIAVVSVVLCAVGPAGSGELGLAS